LITLLGAAALVFYLATQVFGWPGIPGSNKGGGSAADAAPSAPPMPTGEWPGAPAGPGSWQSSPYSQQSTPRYSWVYETPSSSSSGSVNQPPYRGAPQQQGDVIDVWYGGGGPSSGSGSGGASPPTGRK
jgi:hypothetical protein